MNFDYLDKLVEKMGAEVKEWDSGATAEKIDIKPIDFGVETSIREALSEFQMDDKGILYKNGVPWILYIMAPKDATIDELRNNAKGSNNTPRYHITGDCQTIRDMKKKNRYDRYVFTPKIEEKFEVFGYPSRSRWWGKGKAQKVEDVELGVCYNCLKRVGYNLLGKRSTTELKKEFDVKKWFEENVHEKFIKPRFSTSNYPDPEYNEDFGIKSAKLKLRRNWTCENCGFVGANGHKNLIHTDHIDGNSGNNTDSNLRLLCIDCHRHLGQNKSVGSRADFDKCVQEKHVQNKRVFTK